MKKCLNCGKGLVRGKYFYRAGWACFELGGCGKWWWDNAYKRAVKRTERKRRRKAAFKMLFKAILKLLW